MKVRTLPALQLLIAASAMYGLATWFPLFNFATERLSLLSVVIACVGVALILAGGIAFRRANTTVSPMSPDKTHHLVTEGVYCFSRNPMYLGFLLILVAWAVYLGEASTFIMPPIFVWVITRYQILPEERILMEKFGRKYSEYVSRVKRWV